VAGDTLAPKISDDGETVHLSVDMRRAEHEGADYWKIVLSAKDQANLLRDLAKAIARRA
jgi:hypothetical protein